MLGPPKGAPAVMLRFWLRSKAEARQEHSSDRSGVKVPALGSRDSAETNLARGAVIRNLIAPHQHAFTSLPNLGFEVCSIRVTF
jgi:hypothetical protein